MDQQHGGGQPQQAPFGATEQQQNANRWQAAPYGQQGQNPQQPYGYYGYYGHYGNPPQWQSSPQYAPWGMPMQQSDWQAPGAPAFGQPYTPAPPPRKPKKRRALLVLSIMAAAMACVLLGYVLATNVVLPMLHDALQEDYPGFLDDWLEGPSKPILKEDDYAPNPDIDKIGGTAPTITNAVNPVPEVAEQLAECVVGVNAYVLEDDGEEEVLYSRGTGFIIHESGYILTNYHVVAEGSSYTISLEEGDIEVGAKYVGGDASMDLAVLKVEGSGMKAAALGSSASTKVGELAIAMGNPAGADADLTGSVTVGYVSYVGRKLNYNGSQQDFLQIDAAVNPGNSGGPLLNSRGEVIGIVTLKSLISSYDEYGNPINSEGLGFAIPIDAAKEIALRIIRTGSIRRPAIGILYIELTSEEAEKRELPQGKLVQEFMYGSPAEAAGMELGDVIIKCNGVLLSEEDILVQTIQSLDIGDTITLTVWRDGEEIDLIVEIADMNAMVVY